MTWWTDLLAIEEKHQLKVKAFKKLINSLNAANNDGDFFTNMLLFYWKLYTLQLAEFDALVLHMDLAKQATMSDLPLCRRDELQIALQTMQRVYRRYKGFQLLEKEESQEREKRKNG